MISAMAGMGGDLAQEFHAASISATSVIGGKGVGHDPRIVSGSAERIMISPRLVGRQLERPIEKPGQGSGVRIGRSPVFGMTVEKAWK